MAANKFATMVHRNTNKMTLVLVYAVLEWTLILLLLLNSLLSFLIVKFSQLFGVESPCIWCSTLHRFFEPQNINLHRHLLCDFHSKEVSVLGFCPNHKRLAEIKDFCDDCFSCHLRFQSEVKHSDKEDEQNLKCSCCGLELQKQSINDFLPSRNSYDILESSERRDLILGVGRKIGSGDEIDTALMEESSRFQMNDDGKDVWKSSSHETETCLNQFEESPGDSTSDFLPQDLEFFFDFSGSQLVPIELIDSTTEESQNISEADEDHEFGEYQKAQVIQEHETPGLESMDMEETENALVFHAKFSQFKEESAIVEKPPPLFVNTEEHHHQETTIETVKLELNNHLGAEETETTPVLKSCVEEEPSTASSELRLKIENNGLESKNSSIENEEERIPNTPTSVKKFFMFERKEPRAEESLEGSLMSEMEGGDPINTTEKLKSAISALKAELEEERSASAVAASETMAMITRLQEEKAAMQMEALQYQRMMEEQSEYDQEALQLLNELMIKKEKELEMYRKKVADYEARERIQWKSNSCNDSSSHSDDGNGITHEWNNKNVHDSSVVENEIESSLADFEEERLSIFEQIKVLEEKLFGLSDEDFTIENLDAGNGNHSNELMTESNEKELENGKKRTEMEEEVDQVYERLQALETDREFLKHCIGSLEKGGKGIEILQEILQHLRDLRTIDFQT